MICLPTHLHVYSSGWIHRLTLKQRDVEELSGCRYLRVADEGLVIEQGGKTRTLDVSQRCTRSVWVHMCVYVYMHVCMQTYVDMLQQLL
jgi:hypothetical protein